MNWGDDKAIEGALMGFSPARDAPAPDITESEWWRQIGTNARASFRETWATGLSVSRSRAFAEAYAPIVDALNEGRAAGERIANPYSDAAFSMPDTVGGESMLRDAAEARLWGEVERAREKDPGRFANIPMNRDFFYEEVHARAREAMEEAERVRRGSAAIPAAVGGFIGAAPALLTDPPNLLAAAFGGTPAMSYLKYFLSEAAAGAGATAFSMPEIAAWREEIGRAMTLSEQIADIGFSGLAGGAMMTGARALYRNAARPAFLKAQEALTRISESEAEPDLRAAANQVRDVLERAEENPLAPTRAGEQRHAKALQAATAAIDRGEPAAAPSLTGEVVRAAEPVVEAEQRRSGYTVEAFRPEELETDAATMQYKRGGDEAGVTDRLQDVTQWNPAFAGQVLVWEGRDGRRIVADGHQRLGLAKRLSAEGQDVTLYGVVLREADGVTARDARILAATKNIAEGSGDALDAAAVLRERPEAGLSLPPRSPLVRRARDLTRLSKDAWGMVWNGLAQERDAALVGRLVQDRQIHAAILDYVTKAGAETLEEAELIVRQAVAAGARSETQTDMFGAMLKADLILPERVKILKAALAQLRKDRGLFKILTERENRIEAAGNVLAKDANARALEATGRVLETVKALAERKGEISDALQRAALASRETKDRRSAIAGFVADVRRSVEQGRVDGGGAGGTVRDLEPSPEGADGTPPGRQPGEPGTALEPGLFSDPKGKPDAFARQREALARELGGEAMHAETPEGAEPSPLGEEAARELKAFDSIDPNEELPSLFGEDPVTAGELRKRLENEAKAVERLRPCGGEE